MFLAGFCSSVWVAITCSTSDVPMPNARAPIAPWVDVWLSPQTMVVPGRLTAQFRADDVDDALAYIEDRDVRHAEFDDVLLQGLDLDAAVLLLDAGGRAVADGRDVMVGDGDGQVGATQLAAGQPQALEGLRAGHLVQEVAVDVEDAGAVGKSLDDVAVPDLVEKGAWPAGGHVCSQVRSQSGDLDEHFILCKPLRAVDLAWQQCKAASERAVPNRTKHDGGVRECCCRAIDARSQAPSGVMARSAARSVGSCAAGPRLLHYFDLRKDPGLDCILFVMVAWSSF